MELNGKVDTELLHELECQICINIMKPPIRLCETGHSFCESCFDKILKCPLCEGIKTEMRNFTLENLLEKVNLPCKNQDYGCDFVDRGWAVVKTHELICEYKPKKCPYRVYDKQCPWEGPTSSLYNHLQECMASNIIKPPLKASYATFNIKRMLRLVMFEFGQIFLFSYSQLNNMFRYNTYIIGGEPTEEFFYYRFTISDENGKEFVSTSGRCLDFPEYGDHLMKDTECVMFPIEIFKRMGEKLLKMFCKLELYKQNQ